MTKTENCIDAAVTDRLSRLPRELGEALEHVADAAERLALTPGGCTEESALRRLVHKLFEDSVMEFFAAATTSTKLPAQYMDRCVPDPEAKALPAPGQELQLDLLEALDERRSRRDFGTEPLPLTDLSTFLHWSVGSRGTESGYGVSGLPLFRFPTIGGLCGLRFDLLVSRVDGLAPGRYRYDPVGHGLRLIDRGDFRRSLVEMSFESDWLFYAPVVVACIIDQGRSAWKYKTRSYRYAHVDLGAAVEAMCLVSAAMGLSACPVAAFFDESANSSLLLDGLEQYLALLFPVGNGPRLGPV